GRGSARRCRPGFTRAQQVQHSQLQQRHVHKSGGKLDWGVGGGARLGIGDMFTLTAAGVYADGYNGWANDFNIANDDKFWAASAGVLVNVAEHARLEIGGGYEEQ